MGHLFTKASAQKRWNLQATIFVNTFRWNLSQYCQYIPLEPSSVLSIHSAGTLVSIVNTFRWNLSQYSQYIPLEPQLELSIHSAGTLVSIAQYIPLEPQLVLSIHSAGTLVSIVNTFRWNPSQSKDSTFPMTRIFHR